MTTLTIIQPEPKKKATLNCCKCKLFDYSHAEYEMFKGLSKLVYFKFADGSGPFCHYCITDEVLAKFPKGTKEVEVAILDGKLKTQRKMYASPRTS